jgi:hypothetical protein
MGKKLSEDRPRFEDMSKEQLIAILDEFRSSLSCCEDAQDFCGEVAEKLRVDLKSGAYDFE